MRNEAMITKYSPAIDSGLKSVARLVKSVANSGEVDNYAGKRHKARISDAVQLEMTETVGATPFAVSMHNISENGCAFWIKHKIEIHGLVYVREFTGDNSAAWIPARVTHCTQGIRGYLVGASFGADEK